MTRTCSLVLACALALCLSNPRAVSAQAEPVPPDTAPAVPPEQPPPAPPPEAPAPAPAPAAAPAPVEVPAAPPELAPQEALPPESAAEPPAVEAATEPPALSVGVGLRAGLAFDPEAAGGDAQLNHDQLDVRPYFSGQLNEYVSFEANLDGSTAGISVLDAVAKLSFHDLFNVWFGQFLPPSERNNLSGPYYQNAWTYPTFVHAFPFDIAGRDRGVAFWGQVAGGVFKYQLGLFDLEPGNPVKNSRLAARLVANLLDPEPGYYNSSTYYGDKDVLALGGTLQYQDPVGNPGGEDDDKLLGWQLDLLFEKNLQDSGVLSLEGAYWNFKGADDAYFLDASLTDPTSANPFVAGGEGGAIFTAPGHSFFLLAAWMTPDEIGIGKLQPMARLQFRKLDANPDSEYQLDAGLNYVVDGHNLRFALLFSHVGNPAGPDTNALLAGTQIQLW